MKGAGLGMALVGLVDCGLGLTDVGLVLLALGGGLMLGGFALERWRADEQSLLDSKPEAWEPSTPTSERIYREEVERRKSYRESHPND